MGIAKAFGGTAAQDALTFGGRMEQLANTMGDFMEAVGDFQKNALEPTLRDLNSLAKSFKENETLIKIVGGGMMVLAGAFVMMVSGGAIRLVVGLFMALGKQVKVLVGVLPKLSKGFTGLIGKIFGKKGVAKAVEKTGEAVVKTSGSWNKWVINLLSGITNLSLVTLAVRQLTKETVKLSDAEVTRNLKQEKINERNKIALLALEPVREKQLEANTLLASSTKVQFNTNKALFKTIKEVEAATGQDIVLTESKIEQLGLHAAAVAGLTEKERLLFEERLRLNEQTQAGSISDDEAMRRRIDGLAQFGQTLASLKPGNKSYALLGVRLTQIQAIANAYGSFNQYMDMDPPRPVLATLALAQGLANAAVIEKQMGKIKSAALGADFITQGPQMMMIGDNPSGKEHVQVTPLGNNRTSGGGGGSRSVNINIGGNILGTQEFVRDTLIPEIENTIERNLA
jgi:hypothetical protein